MNILDRQLDRTINNHSSDLNLIFAHHAIYREFMKRSLGILGGLGPLASAEFLKTIYEFNVTDIEQESPTCILYSDPTFPERADAIIRGSDDQLLALLVKSLESLYQMGVSKVVIACVTMHYFLPKVPVSLRENVIPLIDLIVKEVLNTKKTHLLLCANGARQAGIFQKHDRWHQVEQYILLPDEEEQNQLQNYINGIKKNYLDISIIDYFDTLVKKYQVNLFIAGCTELHLVKKHLMQPEFKSKSYSFVDPLSILAANLNSFMDI